MSGTHEHLEHAEHAGHGADPFTMRVAMTMAIIAAILAAVSLVGHRKHNENLILIGEANRHRTEAAAHRVEASNLFAWYQSKRLRVEQARTNIKMTELLAAAPDSAKKREDAVAAWKKYDSENNPPKESIKLDSHGLPDEKDDTLPALQIRGNAEREHATKSQEEAEKTMNKAEHIHHQADWLDLAHLAVELGLVLCTVAVLTKRKEFWLAGAIAAIAGIGMAAYGLYMVH